MSDLFKDYDKSIRDVLSAESSAEKNKHDWPTILNHHLEMISIIQHERLIHLLVTIFVGISMLLTCLVTLITLKPFLLLLDAPLLGLFLGYIFHYRFLENTTQSWYGLTGLIREKI